MTLRPMRYRFRCAGACVWDPDPV
ncbi:hypothetical protein CGRA01v4_05009 [Colletotrichum graminicola]|nr:hypothetical protein CGRA01v4_05009 [Colletotrichum graminicola]